MGEYGDFMGTLQQISALVVGEMWGLVGEMRCPTLRENVGLCFCSTERRLGMIDDGGGEEEGTVPPESMDPSGCGKTSSLPRASTLRPPRVKICSTAVKTSATATLNIPRQSRRGNTSVK